MKHMLAVLLLTIALPSAVLAADRDKFESLVRKSAAEAVFPLPFGKVKAACVCLNPGDATYHRVAGFVIRFQEGGTLKVDCALPQFQPDGELASYLYGVCPAFEILK
jgi:hypothetical protein